MAAWSWAASETLEMPMLEPVSLGLTKQGQSEFVDEFLRRPRPAGCYLHGPSYGLALFRQKRRRAAFVKGQGHGICIPVV